MGPKQRREREREEVRTRILDAARDIFVREGSEALTMRRIAETIEYSATAIYFHFRDKEALLRELCRVDFLSLAQSFGKIARVADAIDRLRKIGHAYAEFALTHPNHYQLMFMVGRAPKEQDVLEKGNPTEDAYAFVRLTIAEGLAHDRFRADLKDIDLIAQTVWAGVHGVVALEIARGDDPWIEWRPIKKRVQLMVDLLIDGLAEKD